MIGSKIATMTPAAIAEPASSRFSERAS